MLGVQELREIFDGTDVDNKGHITFEELYKNLTTNLGYRCPAKPQKFPLCIQDTDLPRTTKMDFHRFLSYMEQKEQNTHCMAKMRMALEEKDVKQEGFLKQSEFEGVIKNFTAKLKSMNYEHEEVVGELEKIELTSKNGQQKVFIDEFLTAFWSKKLFK